MNACHIASGGVFDSLMSQFCNAAATWEIYINPIAKKIFYILFGMEFMWQLTVRKIFAGDVEKLWVFFFTRSVLGFFFAKYLVDVNLYKQIIEYFASLGGMFGGFTLNLTPGHNFGTLGPSEVISNFACIADSIHQATDSTGAFEYLTLKFSLAIMLVLLLVILVYIAFYLMKVILQAYFLLYAGFILTGFAGSSWTMSFWQRYLQAIIGMSVKFLAVCFLFGVLNIQIKSWAADISTATNIISLGSIILKTLGSAMIIGLLAHQLPEWAASTLAGSINMNLESSIPSLRHSSSGASMSKFNNTTLFPPSFLQRGK